MPGPSSARSPRGAPAWLLRAKAYWYPGCARNEVAADPTKGVAVSRGRAGDGPGAAVQPAGSSARYESRVGDNHHHLICRTCSRMVDVDCAIGDTPCLTAADGSGYEIDEAEVIYWGRCPECGAATSVSSGA